MQFGSPTEMTILQEVINARYESVLPTILISNLTFEQLKESIGERIVDRVTDGGRNRGVWLGKLSRNCYRGNRMMTPVWKNNDLEGAVIGAIFLRNTDPEVLGILSRMPASVFSVRQYREIYSGICRQARGPE